jgi:outer membrane protein assembly factor BamA
VRRGALALAALLLVPIPAGASLVRRGPEPFSVASLAAWEGRTVTSVGQRGRSVTRDYVVTREIRTAVGAPLDLIVLDGDLRRLANLSVFSDIRVEAAEDGASGVAITFVFKESPAYVPFVSFTYTEENGFSIGPSLSALNVQGRALRLSGRAYWGGTNQYWASVDWPWAFGDTPHPVNLLVAHRNRTDELRGFEESSDEVTTRVGRYFAGDRGRASANLSLFNMRSDVVGITLSDDLSDHLLRAGFTVGLDTRDSWRDPRRGWQSELQVWRTTALDGPADSWSADLDLRRWIPTATRQKLLLSSLLTVQSGALGVDVPSYLDYRIGGANSVRGYAVDDLGDDLSGKNQLLGTAEYSFTVMPVRRWDIAFLSFAVGLELAVFGDAGIAWSEGRQFALDRARGGVGSGIRLLVPGTEMVRFDVGWSPDSGFHFHFASGAKPVAQRNRLR